MKTTLWTCSLLAFGLMPLKAVDAPALLIVPDDPPQRVWVTASSSTNIEYKTTTNSVDRKRVPRSKVDSVYFFEPKPYKAAMKLYRNRDYKGAQEQFTLTKEAFKSVDDLPGNFSTLAAFYELECARRQGDLEGLSALLENYLSGPLMREDQKAQEEVYVVWDAVRTKSWPRLNSLADEMLSQNKWTSSQLAQIYYCKGLALEALNRPLHALNAFNGAFTADFTASEELTKLATLACLRIIDNHDEVRLARDLYDTEDRDENSEGHRLLLEGTALCELWNKALGGGKALPEEYRSFLKYKKKEGPVSLEEKPKADKKPEAGEKPKADKKPKAE